MPYKRENTYYVKRSLPGIGQTYKTLCTSSATRAQDLESMVLKLCDRGHLEPVQAWLDDRVTVQKLAEAYESGQMPGLMTELRSCAVPLVEAIDRALTSKAPDVKPTTLRRYFEAAQDVKRVAFKRLGPDATVQQVLDDEFVQEYKAGRLKEKAAKSTINKGLQVISLLATYGLKREWITKRPTIRRYTVPDRIQYIESDQIPAYMAAVRSPFRVQFQLLIGTAMRLGETEDTRVCDVRFGHGECRILLKDAKTPTGVRPVFVPPWCADALRIHIDQTGRSGTDPVFQIPRRTVQKEHGRACRIAGIIDYTIHDHRHTAAVHLARSGLPLDMLQKQLGHKHIQQTMKYAAFHPEYNDVGRFFDVVAERLGVGQGASQGAPGTSPEMTVAR